jgi:hypothetical protein
MIDSLLSMHEALSSIPSTEKKKNKKIKHTEDTSRACTSSSQSRNTNTNMIKLSIIVTKEMQIRS